MSAPLVGPAPRPGPGRESPGDGSVVDQKDSTVTLAVSLRCAHLLCAWHWSRNPRCDGKAKTAVVELLPRAGRASQAYAPILWGRRLGTVARGGFPPETSGACH